MVYALAVRLKKVGEDGGTRERLDELKGQAGGEGRVAEFEGVGGGVPAVGLPGCVGGRAGVDGPGAEAESAEGAHGEEVGAGDLEVWVGGWGWEGRGAGCLRCRFLLACRGKRVGGWWWALRGCEEDDGGGEVRVGCGEG